MARRRRRFQLPPLPHDRRAPGIGREQVLARDHRRGQRSDNSCCGRLGGHVRPGRPPGRPLTADVRDGLRCRFSVSAVDRPPSFSGKIPSPGGDQRAVGVRRPRDRARGERSRCRAGAQPVANFAGYPIERNSIIGDSHIIGSSAEDRIAVRRATSRRFTNVHPEVKVLGHSTSAAVDVARPVHPRQAVDLSRRPTR
jgi:hypothetical protein